MDHTEFLRKIDELLEKPDCELTGPERLEDLEGWDSMAVIGFMAIADEHFGRKLSPPNIAKCQTVDDLFALVQDHP